MAETKAIGLTADEHRIIQLDADTSRWFGGGELPETVSGEVALRLAEKAYRRGVQQGAHFMRRHLHPPKSPSDWQIGGPGSDYESALYDWRVRGRFEDYAYGELPPSGPDDAGPTGFGAWLVRRHGQAQTAIGDLARDVAQDSTWPRPHRSRETESLEMYQRYLERYSACDEALDALADAWGQYQRAGGKLAKTASTPPGHLARMRGQR